MLNLVIVLVLIVSAILTLLILAQQPKNAAGAFASSSPSQSYAKRSGDMIETLTWYLGGALVVLCLVATFSLGSGSGGRVVDPNLKKAEQNLNSVTNGGDDENLDAGDSLTDDQDNVDPAAKPDSLGE